MSKRKTPHNFWIKDWAGNLCFTPNTFKSFDHAEDFLSVTLGDAYETDRQEYFIFDVTDLSEYYRDRATGHVRLGVIGKRGAA